MWLILTPKDQGSTFQGCLFQMEHVNFTITCEGCQKWSFRLYLTFSFTYTYSPLICSSSKAWKPIVEKYPQFCGHCPALTFNSSRSSCLLDYPVLSGGDRWKWQVFSCQVERVKVEQSVRPIGMQDCSLLGDRIIALYGPWRSIWIIWRQRGCNLKGNGTKAACFFILLPN